MSGLSARISELISQNKTGEGLDLLASHFKDKDKDLYNQFILLTSRHNDLRKKSLLGLIDDKVMMQGNAQINYAILDIISGIKDEQETSAVNSSHQARTHEDKPAASTEKEAAPRIFFSYSTKDKNLRDELEAQFAAIKKYDHVMTWHGAEILPGTDWDGKIKDEIRNANIILLLISADYLASEYCGLEMDLALQKSEDKTATVIPVILRPCDWKNTPLAKLNALPPLGKPVTKFKDRDEAYLLITEKLKSLIKLNSATQNGN